jgi:CheY-like chemotaxis protein
MAASPRDVHPHQQLLSSGLFAFGAASVAGLALTSGISMPALLGGACVGVLVSGWMVGMNLPTEVEDQHDSVAWATEPLAVVVQDMGADACLRPSLDAASAPEAQVRVGEELAFTARPLTIPNVAREAGDLIRVLLAEDGRDNQKLISHQLHRAGMQVTVAENGEIAFQMAMAEACKGTPYDVILMDMQMPVLDGYGAATKLRAVGYGRPIVALTAHAMVGDRERCIEAGCTDYLTKPIDRVKLIHTICVLSDQHDDVDDAPMAPEIDEDDAEMAEVVEMFVADLVIRVTDLHTAARRGDVGKVRNLAHQLKGAGGGYGFPKISAAADAVEQATRIPGNGDAILRAVNELASLCERARPLAAAT